MSTPRNSAQAVRVRCARSRNGSALLTVLWLTAALSAIGLAVANNVRGETERTSTGVDDTKSYFIARGAIERAALHVLWRAYSDPSGQPIYFRTGQPVMNLDFPNAQVAVEIIPETSKLNPNTILPEDLLRLFSALGVPIDRASQLTSAIVDWRTPVNPMQVSPFDAFYLSQSPSFLPRHASFQENEELLLTQGMTPGIYYGESLDDSRPGLRDCLSVYGSGGAVDVNTAQPATLQAVGLSPDDALAIAQRRAIRPFDSNDMAQLQMALGVSGQRLILGGRVMYTLRATARLKQTDGKLSDLRRTIAALVQFTFPGNTKNKPVGYQVVRWFDRT
jgi:general secretion pathway protein K